MIKILNFEKFGLKLKKLQFDFELLKQQENATKNNKNGKIESKFFKLLVQTRVRVETPSAVAAKRHQRLQHFRGEAGLRAQLNQIFPVVQIMIHNLIIDGLKNKIEGFCLIFKIILVFFFFLE